MPDEPSAEQPTEQPTLRHALTTAQLTMIAIGGAIGTGLFLGSGFAIGLAGPGVLLSYALGAVVALLLMGSLAEMSAADPAAGARSFFSETYLSPLAGFLVRYSYWAAVTLAVGAEVSAIAVYMRFWFPTIPGALWVVLFAGSLVVLNALRVETFGAVEYVLSFIKVAAIVLFLALGAFLVLRAPHAAHSNFVDHGGLLPHGVRGAWEATVIALFSYFSLEMVAVAAAEARDPRTAVVRAFRATFFRLVVFYLGTLAVTLALIPWTAVANGRESPLVRVLHATSVPYAASIMNAVLLIAALSAINSQLYVASRMLFSLAGDGFAPRLLGRVSNAGSPRAALYASSAGIAVAAVVQALAPAEAFISMMAIATFGAMFTWMMIFCTHLGFAKRRKTIALPFRMAFYPAAPLLGAVMMLALLLTTAFVPGFQLTLLCGLPFLAAITLAYFLLFRHRRIIRG
jgi:AAT family amino acid transporter